MRVARRQACKRAIPAALAGVIVAVAFGVAGADLSDLEDLSGEILHADTVVPEPSRKVGEVRLLQRGDAVVVQTLLSTRLLERVIAEIGSKEKRNWPEGDEATAAYLAALDNARRRLEQRDAGPDWSRRRHRLLIEFAAADDYGAVFVGTYDFAGDGRTVRDREVFEVLSLRRDYVLRNMRLILADSFGVPVEDVGRLGPLGPAAPERVGTRPDTSTPKGAGTPGDDARLPGDAAVPPAGSPPAPRGAGD